MINTIEDLLQLEDRQIQLLLRELESENLAIALISASTNLQIKIFANMSERAIDAIKNDMTKHMGIEKNKIENQQSEIIKIANSLFDSESWPFE